MYREYKDNEKVAIYFVYIREAHPTKPGSKKKDGVAKHESIDDKIQAAMKCIKGLELTVPVLIDSIDLKAQKAYRAAYASTVVIDKEGKIAFHSRGPGGTKPKEAKETLQKLLEKDSKVIKKSYVLRLENWVPGKKDVSTTIFYLNGKNLGTGKDGFRKLLLAAKQFDDNSSLVCYDNLKISNKSGTHMLPFEYMPEINKEFSKLLNEKSISLTIELAPSLK